MKNICLNIANVLAASAWIGQIEAQQIDCADGPSFDVITGQVSTFSIPVHPRCNTVFLSYQNGSDSVFNPYQNSSCQNSSSTDQSFALSLAAGAPLGEAFMTFQCHDILYCMPLNITGTNMRLRRSSGTFLSALCPGGISSMQGPWSSSDGYSSISSAINGGNATNSFPSSTSNGGMISSASSLVTTGVPSTAVSCNNDLSTSGGSGMTFCSGPYSSPNNGTADSQRATSTVASPSTALAASGSLLSTSELASVTATGLGQSILSSSITSQTSAGTTAASSSALASQSTDEIGPSSGVSSSNQGSDPSTCACYPNSSASSSASLSF